MALVIENLSVEGLIVLLGVTGLLLHTDGFLEALYAAAEHGYLLSCAGCLLLKGEQLLVERFVLISLLRDVLLQHFVVVNQAGLHLGKHISILLYQLMQLIINVSTEDLGHIFIVLHQIKANDESVLSI